MGIFDNDVVDDTLVDVIVDSENVVCMADMIYLLWDDPVRVAEGLLRDLLRAEVAPGNYVSLGAVGEAGTLSLDIDWFCLTPDQYRLLEALRDPAPVVHP